MSRRKTRQRRLATGWKEQRTERKTPTDSSSYIVRQEEMPGMPKRRRIRRGGLKQEKGKSTGGCSERVSGS